MQILLRILGLLGRWFVNVILLLLLIFSFETARHIPLGSSSDVGLKLFLFGVAFFLMWVVDRGRSLPKPKKKLSWRGYLLAVFIGLLVFIVMETLDAIGARTTLGFLLLIVSLLAALFTWQGYSGKRKKQSPEPAKPVSTGTEDF